MHLNILHPTYLAELVKGANIFLILNSFSFIFSTLTVFPFLFLQLLLLRDLLFPQY